MAAQHADLGPARWSGFSRDQQLLMIANEWHRAGKLLAAAEVERRRNACERVLRLVDLTVEVQPRRALRRELLRFRDVVATLYLEAGAGDPIVHRQAARCLHRLDATVARQLDD